MRRGGSPAARERTRRSSDQRVHRNPVTLVTPIVRYPALNLSHIIYDHSHHTLLGGCACGAVRYESTAEPVMMLHCHCRGCQRSSGGQFSSFVIVPAEAFKLLQGSLRFHPSPSEMGGMTGRGFCPECGSPIVVKPDSVPEFVAIRTASLDDPSWFNPQVDVWTSDAHPWDQMNPGLPEFEKYPPVLRFRRRGRTLTINDGDDLSFLRVNIGSGKHKELGC